MTLENAVWVVPRQSHDRRCSTSVAAPVATFLALKAFHANLLAEGEYPVQFSNLVLENLGHRTHYVEKIISTVF